MDPELINVIEILFVVAVVFFAIAKSFLKIFVKPFIPDSAQGGPEKKVEITDFLKELRRDLGHGNLPPPMTDGLLDEEKEEMPRAGAPTARPQTIERRFGRPPVQPRPVAPAPPPPVSAPRLPGLPLTYAQAADASRLKKAAQRIHPAMDPTIDQLETEALAVEAGKAPLSELERQGVDEILGTDLGTAIMVKEILGPPRAYNRWRRRM